MSDFDQPISADGAMAWTPPRGYRFRQWLQQQRHKAWDWLLDYVLTHHPMVRDSNLVQHADEELRRAGWAAPDSMYNGMLHKATLQQIKLFSIAGHSGFSASIGAGLANALMKYKPLTPLTGEDDEWVECGENYWQNRRCGHVFKGADGRAYDIDAKVYREPSGACFTKGGERHYITFPYTPTVEYIDVPKEPDDAFQEDGQKHV